MQLELVEEAELLDQEGVRLCSVGEVVQLPIVAM